MKHMNHCHPASKKKQAGAKKLIDRSTDGTTPPDKVILAGSPDAVATTEIPLPEFSGTVALLGEKTGTLPEDLAPLTDEPEPESARAHVGQDAATPFGVERPEATAAIIHETAAETEGISSFPGLEGDLSPATQGAGTAGDHPGLEAAAESSASGGQTASDEDQIKASTQSALSPTSDQEGGFNGTSPVSELNGTTSGEGRLTENTLVPGADVDQEVDGQCSPNTSQPEISSVVTDLTGLEQERDACSPFDVPEQPQLPSRNQEQVMLAPGQDIDEVIEAILKRAHIQGRVPLDLIDFYPKNRQLIKPEALRELAASIASVGVINDVLLRPLPNGRYEVVAGEQRTRASRIAGQVDIPAKIYELTDTEARQIRVSENLHRENYHPMEEALAIGEMKEDYPSLDLIARRLGKPVNYVQGRIKLLSLVPEAQEILLADAIGLRDAQELAAFQDDVQQTFIARHLSGWKTKGKKYSDLREQFDKLKCSLKNPPFNMKDPNLVPEMGICATCEFNSGCQQALFADLAEDPVCRKATCYQAKSDKQLVKNVTEAVKKHTPMAIVTVNVLSDEQRELIKDIPGTEGLEFVLEKMVFEVKKPQSPKLDKFKDAKGKIDKKAFDDATFHYKEAVAYQDSAIRNRKIFRSIRIQQDGTVESYMFTRDSKAGPTGQSGKVALIQDDIKAGTVTIKQLLDELARIRDNEKSATKKDASEVAEKVHAAVEVGLDAKEIPVSHNPLDTAILRWMMFEKLHYSDQRQVGERFFGEGWSKLSPEDLLVSLQNLTDDQTAYLSRKVFVQINETKHADSTGGYLLSQLAQATGIDLATLRQETDKRAEERTKKFKKNEAELQKKITQKKKKLSSKMSKTTSEQD